jgi:hypothetical protein
MASSSSPPSNLLMRRLIPPAPDQEIQPKECCCRCTESDNNYTFRVERIQRQIDEPICAHDEQSQNANQVDRSAHAASPVNAGVCPSTNLSRRDPALQGTSWVAGFSHAIIFYRSRIFSQNFAEGRHLILVVDNRY